MNNDQLNTISSYVSKLIRKKFGRGPKSCRTTANRHFLVTYIQGFLSPMEEVLLSQGQRDQVEKARTVIIDHMIEELTGVVQVSLDMEVDECYHDWNIPNKSGVIIFVFNNTEKQEHQNSIVDVSLLEKEVKRISELVQKAPDQINVFHLSPSLYLVERINILIPIEKALIKKGFTSELILTKDTLEKSYFHRYGRFNEIFKEDIKDIFIDWNIEEDKSFMVFITNP